MTSRRVRWAMGLALALWTVPAPAHADGGHCSGADALTTAGVGTAVAVLLFRPWRRSTTSLAGTLTRWCLPVALALVVTALTCAPRTKPTTNRPVTSARLQILEPTPGQLTGPDPTVRLSLVGARLVGVTSTKLRGDEGHIHLFVDGRPVSMAYGTTQHLHGLSPGPHSVRAELVAADHAPFRNPVVAAVVFRVTE